MAPKRTLAHLVEQLEEALAEKTDLKREHQHVFEQVSSLNKRIKLAKEDILKEFNEIGEETIEIGNSVVSLKRTTKENHDSSLIKSKMDAEKFEEYSEAVFEMKESVQVKPRKKKIIA